MLLVIRLGLPCTCPPVRTAALEAARQHHAEQQAREARNVALAAAFEAAGLSLEEWRYRLQGVHPFLQRGEGSAEELVEQAQAGGQGPALHGYVV